MKISNKLIPEIATIEAINFNFRSLKSTLPIQLGLSSLFSAALILETKFSYPANIIIKIKFPTKAKSTTCNTNNITSLTVIENISGTTCINS